MADQPDTPRQVHRELAKSADKLEQSAAEQTDSGGSDWFRGTADAVRKCMKHLGRETWEHRSIWIAPVALAAFLFVAFLSSLPGLARQVAALRGPDPETAHLNVHAPYGAETMVGKNAVTPVSGRRRPTSQMLDGSAVKS